MENLTTLTQYTNDRKRRNYKTKKVGVASLFLGPYAICFVMFFVFPFVFGIVMSFFKFDGTSMMPSEFVGFDNYIKVFTSPILIKDFWGSVSNTIIFAMIIVPLSIVLPLCLALLVNVKPIGYKIFRACIYIPGIFPLTATGLILLKMFSYQNGFINSFFDISLDWFGETGLAWFMVGLFCLWGGIGGNFIIMSAGLENVDKTLYEAADVDGCGAIDKFFYVTFPGISNQLFLCLFSTFIGYMNLYGQVFILCSNTPDQDSMMTAIFTIQNLLMGSSKSYGYAASMGICLGVIIGAFSGLQMFLSRDKKGGNKHAQAFISWQKAH